MEKILQSFLRRLTNLSGNSRSLMLLRLVTDQFLDLHDLDFANNETSFSVIKSLIESPQKVKLCDELDPRDQSVNKNSVKLRKISRMEDFLFQERGARDLYVGWPFVHGKLADGTLVRCPLVFFPVRVSREKGSWYLEKRKDVNITFNKTFLLAYAHYNQVSLAEDLVEFVLNDLDKDSTKFRTQLYQVLKKSQLELNFNQDLFLDQLDGFQQHKKADFEQQQKDGMLKLFSEAVLGIFPQAGSQLVPDYLNLLEQVEGPDLSEFFQSRVKDNPESPENIRFSDQVKEETTFTPFEMDASQEHALKLVKNGNSLVIQGPPGTGKSQLICNLISDYIARGKNVLLVCQKRAALDVVYERLKQQQLHDFVGLVHDFKNDRKEIFEQISRQIDSVDENRQKNNGLDAIHLEREFLQTSRVIDQITEELGEFKNALFDESEYGQSIKSLYLSSDPDAPTIPLNQQYRQFTYEKTREFVGKLNRYLDYYQKFDENHFWASGPSFAQFSTPDLMRIRELLDEIPNFEQQFKEKSSKFASIAMDFETARHFLVHVDQITLLSSNLDNDTVFGFFTHMMSHDANADLSMLTEMERSTMQCFKGDGLETSLASSDLGRFQEALEHAIKARKNPFSWLKWRLLSDEKIFITRVLIANDLKSDKQGFEILLRRIDNRLNYEHIVSKVEKNKWLKDFPKKFRKIDLQNWYFYQKLALKCVKICEKVRTIDQYFPFKNQNRQTYVGNLLELVAALEQLPNQLLKWSAYLTEKQIRAILLHPERSPALAKQLKEDFDSLVEYHAITDGFTREEKGLVTKLIEKTSGQKEEVFKLFENSIAIAWIDHIETKYPILKAVSSYKIDHLTKDLQEAILRKQELSQDILLLKSRERTYEDLSYNRLNNLVTYRDLHHQVTKKRKVWPIRRVISHFHEELFSLLPCWLTSPESASAIFPMEQTFDLVIFDEASQCFAERGVPAMYRGKQVVIVGDDKQLQPNDLYRVRWENEEDESPELEVDSLLSLGKQYLPEFGLRGHYRSKFLELIEFSNLHFYQGKLKLLPDYQLFNASNTSPIQYHKLDGVWQDNSNQIEADHVVSLIQRLVANDPQKSMGVVTFNSKQQSLILDMLDELIDNGNISLPASLFVKNIENVQGDERDIIIFSTAYAPDEKGNLQLRFGSLNQAGGENRLNVAITRAKEAVHIVTSILPGQLKTEKTVNQGPKLLKAYLEYAKQVSDGEWQPNVQLDEVRESTWYLRNRLAHKGEGYAIDKTLPFADLTIRTRNQDSGLILTDDDLYYDTLSPKESHCYRQRHFIEKGWKYLQFYSREYWMNREKTHEKVSQFVNRM
ncbi:MAG: DUF4011 domain-containing protein [Cyclobacteriaceae bacterium]